MASSETSEKMVERLLVHDDNRVVIKCLLTDKTQNYKTTQLPIWPEAFSYFVRITIQHTIMN